MVHNIFNMRAGIAYVPYQDLENKQMLRDLLDSPVDFVTHIRRYSNSLTTQMIFGFRTTSNSDPKLRQLFDCFEESGALAAGASSQLSNLYPILSCDAFHLPCDLIIAMRKNCTKERWSCILVIGWKRRSV
jgi:hypothetical protein